MFKLQTSKPANLKVQYSNFNVQSLPIIKFNGQSSNFKVSQSQSSRFKIQCSKSANPKGQCSKFNVQSQSSYMLVMVILMHKMVGGTDCAAAFIQPFTIFCRPGTSIRTISFSRTKIKLSRSSSLSVRIKELF